MRRAEAEERPRPTKLKSEIGTGGGLSALGTDVCCAHRITSHRAFCIEQQTSVPACVRIAGANRKPSMDFLVASICNHQLNLPHCPPGRCRAGIPLTASNKTEGNLRAAETQDGCCCDELEGGAAVHRGAEPAWASGILRPGHLARPGKGTVPAIFLHQLRFVAILLALRWTLVRALGWPT